MSDSTPLFVGLGRLELQIPEARSLKEKRNRTRSLIERIRARHQVLLIESGYRNLHQRAGYSICGISTDIGDIEARFGRIERTIDLNWDGRILLWEVEFLQM